MEQEIYEAFDDFLVYLNRVEFFFRIQKWKLKAQEKVFQLP